MSGPQIAERRTVDLEAGRIHYRVAGPDDGRPVVFVHGFLVDDALWADVPERLGRRGFRAFAPTWPLASHTAAMKPDADLSPRGVARVVLGFLARLDLRRLASVFRDARLVEVPNAAAFISLDQPARLADEIAAFAA